MSATGLGNVNLNLKLYSSLQMSLIPQNHPGDGEDWLDMKYLSIDNGLHLLPKLSLELHAALSSGDHQHFVSLYLVQSKVSPSFIPSPVLLTYYGAQVSNSIQPIISREQELPLPALHWEHASRMSFNTYCSIPHRLICQFVLLHSDTSCNSRLSTNSINLFSHCHFLRFSPDHLVHRRHHRHSTPQHIGQGFLPTITMAWWEKDNENIMHPNVCYVCLHWYHISTKEIWRWPY